MLLFLDGQSHYDTARIGAKYATVSTVTAAWAVTAEGRFGNCIKRTATTSSGNQVSGISVAPLMTRVGPWTPTNSGVCGFAIKVDDFGRMGNSTISPSNLIFLVAEGPSHHLRVHLNPDGTLSLIRNMGPTYEGGSGPLIIAQSIAGLSQATWMFIEFKWLISSTVGSFEIRVNGVTVLTYSGDTFAHGTGSYLGIWNAVTLLQITSQPTPFVVARICDLYLADLTAPAAADVHDFLGDGSVVLLLPNAPGDLTGWTSSMGPNWDTVNDRPVPDDDASYVSTLSPGVADLYHFDNLPAGALVKGMQLSILARKEIEGSVALAPLVQPPGSSPFQGPTQGVASQAYDHYLVQPYDLNPATGVRFTANEINNGQYGVIKTI